MSAHPALSIWWARWNCAPGPDSAVPGPLRGPAQPPQAHSCGLRTAADSWPVDQMPLPDPSLPGQKAGRIPIESWGRTQTILPRASPT